MLSHVRALGTLTYWVLLTSQSFEVFGKYSIRYIFKIFSQQILCGILLFMVKKII